jgi:hypothetical protein
MEVQQDDCLLQTSLAAGPTEEGSQISTLASPNQLRLNKCIAKSGCPRPGSKQ